MSEASTVDSELAALLDEELFHDDAEGPAPADAPDADAAATAEDHEQQHKRARWTEPESIELDDEDKEFLLEMGLDQDSSEPDEDAAEAEHNDSGDQQAAVCPPHPGWFHDLCIRCGAHKPKAEPGQGGSDAAAAAQGNFTQIKHLHEKKALEVAAHEAARIAEVGLQRLQAQKRLVLVLDLDHTLLNTVRDWELLGPEREAAFRKLEEQHESWIQQQQQQVSTQAAAAAGATAEAGQGSSAAPVGDQPPPQQQQQQEEEQQQQQDEQEGEEEEEEADEADPWDQGPADAPAAAAAAAAAAATVPAADSLESEPEQQQKQEQQQQEQPGSAAAAAAAAGGSAQPPAQPTSQQQQQQQQGQPGSSGGPQQQQQQQVRPVSSGARQLRCGPDLYWFRDKGLWTKLRPGVHAFLAAVSQLYELHIYTMGDKGYAKLMAEVLDPERRLFVGRVISSADSTDRDFKGLDVLLADESMVLILDDTEQVWDKHRANLIQVDRYHYFGQSVKNFDANATFQQVPDEPEQGGMLDNAAQLLTRIHTRVYGNGQQQQQQQQSGRQQQEQPATPQQQQEYDAMQEDHHHHQQQQQQSHGALKRVVRRVQPAAAAAASGSSGSGTGGGSSAGAGSSQRGGLPHHNDVRQCLEAERRNVLAGCCIVFSRCWPQQQQEPQTHPLWQLALKLGARCSQQLRPGTTTHLIVAPDLDNPPGSVPFTDKVGDLDDELKVQAAHRAGIPVVHPDWLLACRFAWRQLPAEQFSLKTYVSNPNSSCCSRRWLGPHPRSGSGGASSSSAAAAAAAAERAAERAAVMRAAGRTGP